MKTVCSNADCKKPFEAARSTRKYCSDACKQAAHRSRHSVTKKSKCLLCGEDIKIGGRGRQPKFCKNSHRVTYNRNLRNHIIRAMTKGCRAFGEYTYMPYNAWVALDLSGTEFWKGFIEEYGYKFNGRYFIDTTSQGVLL